MDQEFLNTREVVLANGDRVSLRDAVLSQLRLQAQLGLEDQEWDAVYHLREVCLGRPIDPEPERFLIRTKWLREDGAVDPALRSVVLSAVRGEGRLLHLDSPYTDPVDRAVAAFFTSREELLAKLDPAETQILFEKPLFERGFDALREQHGTLPEARQPPEKDIRSFVERLMERTDRPDAPDSPPPPPK